MYIDKFKDEDGYVDQNGCYHENAQDFIIIGMLGFCGCGMPQYVMDYVRNSLQIIYDLEQSILTGKLTHEEWENRKKEVFSGKGAEYFMYYFLDYKELTEHGSSVPGWLTEKGQELLSDLNELKEEGYENIR